MCAIVLSRIYQGVNHAMDSTVDYSSRVSWSKGSNIDYVSEIRIGSPSDRVQMCSICTLIDWLILFKQII
jgi:hypothetical protein